MATESIPLILLVNYSARFSGMLICIAANADFVFLLQLNTIYDKGSAYKRTQIANITPFKMNDNADLQFNS